MADYVIFHPPLTDPWLDLPDTSTPATAEFLTHIEQGVFTAQQRADEAYALAELGGGGGTGLVDQDYGDVTVSGVGTVMTIDPGVVTPAKLSFDPATQQELTDHNAATASVHGIPDTSTIVHTNVAQAFAAGIRKTFTADTTTPGLRILGVAGDPSARLVGDVWFNSSDDRLKFGSIGPTTRTVVTEAQTQTLTNKTLTSPTINTPTISGPVLNGAVTGTGVSNDTTLAGDSATEVVTEHAAKTYFDTLVSELNAIAGGANITVTTGGGVTTVATETVYASKTLPVYVRATADETVNNSSTMQDDDTLVVALLANSVYQIYCHIMYDSNTTADFKMGWTNTGGGTWTFDWTSGGLSSLVTSTLGAVNRAAAIISGTQIVGGVGAGTVGVANPCGLVITDASAGNLQFQWAQGTADASNTIRKAGSHIIARRVA